MKLYATYLGPEASKFYLMHNKEKIEFPYQEPVEVDKDAAKYLRTLKKMYTDDPRFKISSDAKKEELE